MFLIKKTCIIGFSIIQIPELSNVYTLKLSNVSGGHINRTNDEMEIVILSSDNPYGLFAFEQRNLEVNEDVDKFYVNIIRFRIFHFLNFLQYVPAHPSQDVKTFDVV